MIGAALAVAALLAAGPPAGDHLLHLPVGDPARRDRTAPVVLDAITDTANGDVLAPADLPGRLEHVRVLLVGEEHTDMDSHRVERRVLEELVRAGRRVTVALEMYPYTEQKALDDWTSGALAEDAFLEASRWYRSWGYNWAYYRDVFLLARDAKLRMRAVNAPREVVSAVRKKGYQGLTGEEAAHIPSRVDSHDPEHMRMFKASFDEESFHAGMDDAAWQAMLDAQCAWDATMGFQAAKALEGDADPKAIVVVLAGSGHVAYGLGIERQLRAQGFAGAVATLIPVPVLDEKGEPNAAVQASYASFVWGTPPVTDPIYPDLGVATRPRADDRLLEVIDVEKGSPASRAGVANGDVLVALDGTALPDRAALSKAMAGKRWGDGATLTVNRGGETVGLTVKLRRNAKPPKQP